MALLLVGNIEASFIVYTSFCVVSNSCKEFKKEQNRTDTLLNGAKNLVCVVSHKK